MRLDGSQGTAGPWHLLLTSVLLYLTHSCWMWNTQSPILEITQVGGEEGGASLYSWTCQKNSKQMPHLPNRAAIFKNIFFMVKAVSLS